MKYKEWAKIGNKVIAMLLAVVLVVGMVPVSVIAEGVQDPLGELKALVAEAEALKQEDYTPETWEPFSYNLQDAQACIKRNETNPEQIGYAVGDLKQGMAGLQKADPNALNTNELQDAINSAKALQQKDYTQASWQNLQNELQTAEAVLKESKKQQEIVATAAALRDAIKNMEKISAGVDKSGLEAVIRETEGLKEQDYTDSSWANLQIALMSAESVLKKADATQEEVDAQTADVRKAIDALKAKIVVDKLQAAIDEAKALNEKDYTAASWKTMQEKLKLADDATIYQKSQEDVDAAEAALRQAVKDLKPVNPEPVEPEKPQGKVVKVGSAAEMPDTIPTDTTVVLTADFIMNKQITKVEGVLDGKGHTITIGNMSIIGELTGSVQNLGVIGTEQLIKKGMTAPSFGAIAVNFNGGKILNSFVQADIKATIGDDQGGFVGTSLKGEIHNCYYAGAAAGGGAGAFISKSNDPSNPSVILNSYYASAKKPVGFGNGYNENEASVAQKTQDFMKTTAFADLLNTNLPNTGYHWEVTTGNLPVLVEGSIENNQKVDTAALKAVIQEAKELVETKFTPESWQAMKTRLDDAEALLNKEGLTQQEVNDAAAALRAAIDGLQKALPTQPVPRPETGVIEVTSAADLNRIMDPAVTKDKYYVLMNDIETKAGETWVSNMAGVLDGNGHTITIGAAGSLFDKVTETGVIQNVNFVGKSDQEIAPAAGTLQGAIINCRSDFSGQSAGFVNKLDGGVIANSLVLGQPAKGAFAQKYGSGRLVNSYWSDRMVNSVPAEAMTDCKVMSDTEMKTTALRDLLNTNRGANGTQWGQGSDGYPYFGADKPYSPEGEFQAIYPVVFTHYNGKNENNEYIMGEEVRIGTDNKLTLNPDDGINQGIFSLKNVPATSTISWSCEDNNHNNTMAINLSTGDYFAWKEGTAVVRATEHTDKGESRKVAEVIVTARKKQIEEFHLFAGDKDVTNGTFTVAGSEQSRITVKVKYSGETELTDMRNGLTFSNPDPDMMVLQQASSGAFSFKKPGTVRMTVTGGGKSAYVDITSTYVPVESIRPAVSGRNELHGKNSMYYGYNTIEAEVVFTPANASYVKSYTVESSDPEVVYFQSGMVLGYIAKKAGKVTLTASVENVDPVTGEKTLVTGTSEAEFYYKNPLKEVTAPAETIRLKAYETPQRIPLTYTGSLPIPDGFEYPYAVTETRMIWTFEGDGEVEITYPNEVQQIRGIEYPDGGEWVSNPNYYVQGISEGTVTAIGTPLDNTNGAQPIRITFEVLPGEAVKPFDIAQFVKDGMSTATDAIYKNLQYKYGEEWKIFNLLRAGEALPKDKLDAYYADVASVVSTWKQNQKPTDIARVILPLALMGRDITNVDGVNLAAMLYNHEDLDKGSNEVAWALIALDALDTQIPADAKTTREGMVNLLLTFQNADGGFGLAPHSSSGADTSAMALQALAPYQNQPEAAAAIEKGLDYLKTIHTKQNHFDAGNCEANAQTVITLAVLDRDVAKEPGFVSSRYNLMTALNTYFVNGEGFKHTADMPKVNDMASVQVMEALDAYNRFATGKSGYWDLTGKDPVNPEPSKYEFLEGVNQKVQQTLIASDLVMKLTGDVKDFTGITVNGTQLAAENYTVARDSVTITLKKAYLDTLKVGTYKIEVLFTDGSAVTRLYVEEAPFIPQKDITVSFTLYGDQEHGENGQIHTYTHNKDEMPVWVTTQSVTVPERSTVLFVFEKMAQTHGLTFVNKGNYISEINGLAEFDNGSNSGWMYLLNGVHSSNGVEEQELQDGDVIIIHYTDDYTREDHSDQEVDKVVALIDAIGEVTLASADKISAARTAYETLTDAQKGMVRNYNKLLAAEKTLVELQASDEDRAAAQKVVVLIDAIGEVTLDSAKSISNARVAYDQLTDLQKKLVSNYDKLAAAEKKLAQLKGPSHRETYKVVGNSMETMAQSYVPQVGSVGGEWIIIGLARSGRKIPAAYYDNVVKYVTENINAKEQLHRAKSSDNSRVILALTAIGKDVTNVADHNLLMGLTDMKYVQKQGINGPIWALIAFDSNHYAIPENSAAKEQVTREKLIAAILDAQLSDGGWDLGGRKSDADMTGMALQALAPYYDKNAEVKAAADKALNLLSTMQNEDGTYGSIDGKSSESSTQVIVALTALGIDPNTDPRFIKNGLSAIDGLCSFAVDDGFKHVPTGNRDQMATEQGYYALTAYYRLLDGKTALYDMTDVHESHRHSYTWIITKPATEQVTGEMVGRCSCGDTITKEIPVVGVSGQVTVEDSAGNTHKGSLEDKDILAQIPLTDEEQAALISGAELKISLSMSDISATVSAADKNAVQKAAGKNKVGIYLDITLFKQVGSADKIPVHDTNGQITISFQIPKELMKEGRTYSIVRVHNGVAELLGCKLDSSTGRASFETDQFSTYALVYSDAGENGNPQTGDETPVLFMSVTMLVSLLALSGAVWAERKKQHLEK